MDDRDELEEMLPDVVWDERGDTDVEAVVPIELVSDVRSDTWFELETGEVLDAEELELGSSATSSVL